MQPICGHVLLSSDVSTRANATDQHTNTLLILENEVLVSHYSGIGTTGTLGAGALGAGAPMKIVVSRACPHTTCSFFTRALITLSCSARTNVLSCSAGIISR